MLRKKSLLIVTLALALVALLALAGCGSGGEKTTGTDDKKPYKIGVVLDVTGPSSSLGVPEENTIKMLVEKINKDGGINGHQLQVVYLDTKSLETEAVLKAQLLVKDNVSLIIGSSTTGPTMTMLKVAQDAKIPLISTAASKKIVEPIAERQYVFKTAQSDALVVGKIGAYLKEKGLTKVAFLSLDNAYGQSGLAEFEAMAAKEGITILAKEQFGAKDTTMQTQLTKINGKNPQAVVVWAIPPSASIVTKDFRKLGINVPLIHSHGIGNKTFIDLAGVDANGVIFPTGKLLVAESLDASDARKEILVEYATEYEKRFGPRSTFGGHAWDALMLAVEALKKAGDEPATLRDEIEKIAGFNGITGSFTMSAQDHNGLTSDCLIWVEIKDGQWTLMK